MKEFKKIVAALMACVAVATVTSGCKNNANVDPRVAEALGVVTVLAEAEVRNDLDEFYEKHKAGSDLDKEDYDKPEIEDDLLVEVEKTRQENRMLQEVLEKTRADLEDTLAELEDTREKLEYIREKLYAARVELAIS